MATDRPAQQSEIKQLISKGLEQGYLTYAEVNDHLPDDIVDPEQIEDIIGMINGMGIEVHEVAPDAETLLLSDATPTRTEDDTVAAEEAAAALAALDAELGRTTDPVRMYMREMGTVELLTREGEIRIAKRIEEGLDQVRTALAYYPPTYEYLLAAWEPVKVGQGRITDLIVGFLDRLFIRRRSVGEEQRLGIRRLLVHRDAHVVDGVDDVLDLLRIDDLGREVVVHLGISQVALLLAARNEQLELGVTIFRNECDLFAQGLMLRGAK